MASGKGGETEVEKIKVKMASTITTQVLGVVSLDGAAGA